MNILHQNWDHDPKMLMVYGVHRVWLPEDPLIRRTLVATINDEVVGVATLIEHTLHPKMLWAAINVAPDRQRQGVGSALYEALSSSADGRPWLVKLTLRDRAGTAFLEKRGFYSPRGRGIMGVLDLHKEEVQRWLEQLPRDVPGYTFLSLDDARNPATLEDVARVQALIYRQYHTWNPPIDEPLARALTHYCGSEVLTGSQLCVFEGENLIGAANVFRHSLDGDDGAYLAHIGVVGREHPHVHELTAALIRRTLEWAEAAGYRVRFEADDEYAPHRTVYQTAPADEIDRDFAIYINA